MVKIAFTGTSGSGKTTLAKWTAKEMGLSFISGAAGDLKNKDDIEAIQSRFGVVPNGHSDVIRMSAMDVNFAVYNQELNRKRRDMLIDLNNNFVTDRSPLDNLTYYVAQCGFHLSVTDQMVEEFAKKCSQSWLELTHVIYLRPAQPSGIENNKSRVSNKWFQRASDAQFQYWLYNYFLPEMNIYKFGPQVMEIDYWDLDLRKERIKKFLNN